MSDKFDASKASRAGAVILGGLVVGAMLGVPVAEAEAPSAGTATVADGGTCGGGEMAVSAVREQFRASFITGAVQSSAPERPAFICNEQQ